ncbi:Protein of unknown function [Pyronema omphalodes CBS 100304]|uniref:Uncharacterized protein n=1 Tax=Pyronema omphalodes (strain CBS 100304) TaxID=1076935 RepID=U4L0D8_PYROM|nr:Protein of unknown function [Pyronema omphalodes CBS 100304]
MVHQLFQNILRPNYSSHSEVGKLLDGLPRVLVERINNV